MSVIRALAGVEVLSAWAIGSARARAWAKQQEHCGSLNCNAWRGVITIRFQNHTQHGNRDAKGHEADRGRAGGAEVVRAGRDGRIARDEVAVHVIDDHGDVAAGLRGGDHGAGVAGLQVGVRHGGRHGCGSGWI